MRYEDDSLRQSAERVARHEHPVGVAVGGPHAVAQANHGRWIALCPFGCGGARLLHPDRQFWCPECGNSGVQGLDVPVDWPDDMDDIAAVLDVRPDETTRNWHPTFGGRSGRGETLLLDLCVENLERGLSVPEHLREAARAALEADWEARGLADEMRRFLPPEDRPRPPRRP